MRSYGIVSLALTLTFVRQSHQAQQVVVDRAKVAELVEMFGLNEDEELSFVEVGSQVAKASPEDVQNGNYEIQCETTCDFKKKGAPFSVHHTPTPAAEGGDAEAADPTVELTKKQKALRRLQFILTSSPDNAALQQKELTLQVEIGTILTDILATAGVSFDKSADPMGLGKALDLAKAQLNKLKDDLTTSTSAVLRDSYKNLLATVAKLEQASADADTQVNAGMDAQIAQLQQRLSELQNERKTKPHGDADLDGAIVQVQKAIEAKSDSAFVPKQECYRVCTHPSTAHEAAISKTLPASGENGIADCVKMCVAVMRKVVGHVAQKIGSSF